VFAERRPDVVFHAAAQKHVPILEKYPCEAVRVNVLGTHAVARIAAESGCRRFVHVSTDKAADPCSVMGATKRAAEQVVFEMGQRHDLPFVAVRFGNVLASRGSVVPTFLRQILDGGPVTVTDPEMTRYFMTIPEAVQLVIQAGDLGAGSSEVFVLEMGEPVKIIELARNMIRLAGYEPETDIPIEVIGVRPGEKIHEELFNSGERPQATTAERIVRAVRSTSLDPDWVEETVDDLLALVAAGDEAGLAEHVVELMGGEGTTRHTLA
jgi:FlaA1/EpsC-like NDP-sugar epimerase